MGALDASKYICVLVFNGCSDVIAWEYANYYNSLYETKEVGRCA